MALYGYSRNATMSTGAGTLNCMHLVALTNRKCKINEISLTGNGATSAAAAYQEVAVKLTTGTAGAAGTALVAQKLEADAPTASGFVSHTQTTDAAVGGANTAILLLGCNNYGGIYRWTARPNGEIVYRSTGATATGGAGSVAFVNNNSNTTAVYSLHTIIDEL